MHLGGSPLKKQLCNELFLKTKNVFIKRILIKTFHFQEVPIWILLKESTREVHFFLILVDIF